MIQPRRLIRLNLGRPGRAPDGGLDLFAGENLAGAGGGAGMPLVDGAVRAGTAGYRAFRLRSVLDVFHRLGFLGVGAQEGRVGRFCGILQLVGCQGQERDTDGQFLEQATAGMVETLVGRPFCFMGRIIRNSPDDLSPSGRYSFPSSGPCHPGRRGRPRRYGGAAW